ncbi:MAG: aromatic-amino-acid transaminase [Planctomycetota bacterium]|jgi:aromatic-amino-acid transaminase
MFSHLIPESADRPGDDPIFTLNADANARRAAGEDVLNSTLGALMEDDGSMSVMQSVFDAIKDVPPQQAAAYAPIIGNAGFLESVRRDLFGNSQLYSQSVAAATPGGTGACYLSIVNFLSPGQSLLTTDYHWGPYGTLANHTGRGLCTFRMFDESGRLDVASLETETANLVKAQGRVLLFLNTPCNNPTGYSMDGTDWAGVVRVLSEAAKKAPITLLLDLAYEKFAHVDGFDWRPSVEELSAAGVNVILAWTASKAFTQYGARVGACVAVVNDPSKLEAVGNALGYSCRGTWSNCNHLGMLAVGQVLRDDTLRAKADGERDRLRTLLDERVVTFNRSAAEAGLEYPRYQGGFFVSVFTPDAAGTVAHMRENGVFVVPLRGAIRIALCATPMSDVERIVQATAAAIAVGT